MHNKQIKQWILILSVSFLALAGISHALAHEPTAVGLREFTATPQTGGIRLGWITETELNTAAFILKRKLNPNGGFATLDHIGFVDSVGGVGAGATYSELDDTAVYGETYTYKLVEIETDTSEHDLASVAVTFFIATPTPTNTPIPLNDNGGGNSTPATNTPVPTSMPGASATPMNTAVPPTPTTVSSNPPTATKTPRPTATAANIVQPPAPSTTPSANDSIGVQPVSAQEPDSEAYPGQATLPPDTIFDGDDDTTNSDDRALIPATPSPYPINPESDTPPTIAVIGSQENRQPDINSSPDKTSEASRGRASLWIGFIIALLIFITGVAGSIVLYKRNRE